MTGVQTCALPISFAIFLGRSPDTATAEDLRRFQVHETEQGSKPPKMKTQVSALRFLFKTTLGRVDLAYQLARVDYPRKLPRVLSAQDVTRLLEAAPGPGLKYMAALSVAYGAGLRCGEIVALRVSDIESKRMLLLWVIYGRSRTFKSAAVVPSYSCRGRCGAAAFG